MNARHSIVSAAENSHESARQCVEDHPLNSVIVSFAVGGLIGFAVSRLLFADDAHPANQRFAAQLRSQFNRALHDTLPDYVAKATHAFTGK